MLQIGYLVNLEKNYAYVLSYPISVYVQLCWALLIQISFYIFLSLIQTFLLKGLFFSFIVRRYLNKWHFFIFFITFIWLISSNAVFFPLSRINHLFFLIFSYRILQILSILSTSILLLMASVAYLNFLKNYPKIGLVGLILLTLGILNYLSSDTFTYSPKSLPNLIIIGIDSLSPAQVSLETMPNLTKFLTQSINFDNAITPLARTYPSWISILTGLYPLHHKARENLYPDNEIMHSLSFAWQFQYRGYQTLYATDDTRFNTLGTKFGFEHILAPKPGIANVLLGSFGDLPLTNLLVNFQMSQWLMPYNYINRANNHTYYPSTFDKALQRKIKQLAKQSPPLMITVHFTLPHWPYSWATSYTAKTFDQYDLSQSNTLYHQALQRVDTQFATLLTFLKKSNILQHSLIMVLSDHGEVLYQSGSRATSAQNYNGDFSQSKFSHYLKKMHVELDKSAGHGSDLLSPEQFHCILSFQIWKNNQIINSFKRIQTSVSLLDIAPTIAKLFNLKLNYHPDGISLLSFIKHSSQYVENRLFFLESGLAPNAILTKEKILTLAQQIFQINPQNNLIEMKPTALCLVNAAKIYGAIQYPWLLALYPDKTRYITVLLNLKTKIWQDDFSSSFIKHAPFHNMLYQLKQFYHTELAHYPFVNDQCLAN
ncbi:MAG: sulfatase [Legionellaceae bacterium]|nr:sulfatase [Legionellaceae bacterium]HCA90005.1 sulfatase [Legionellales bacterium]|tara:strand:- start:659 stop:2623 length:1965 start_codon:yes stop_codon:yes gene_type:complete